MKKYTNKRAFQLTLNGETCQGVKRYPSLIIFAERTLPCARVNERKQGRERDSVLFSLLSRVAFFSVHRFCSPLVFSPVFPGYFSHSLLLSLISFSSYFHKSFFCTTFVSLCSFITIL